MEKLVRKAKKGDAEAFITLMEQNRQSMIRIAFAYLGKEGLCRRERLQRSLWLPLAFAQQIRYWQKSCH